MASSSQLHQPEGWLLSPDGKKLLHFLKDPMSMMRLPSFYSDLWNVSPVGTPNQFINRRKAGLGATLETWMELVENGWTRIDSRFGPDAA